VTGAEQPPGNTPDKRSVPANEIVTGAVYQPVGLSGIESVITSLTAGGVSSMLIGVTVAVPTFPALSAQEPDADWFAPCVLTMTGAEQLEIPDIESIPVKVTVTEELFQPYASGSGERVPLTMGGVVSRLMVTLWVVVPPALVAEQVKVCPVVSVVTDAGPQPVWLVIGATASVTFQVTVTLPVCQPLVPSVPATLGEMFGPEDSKIAVYVTFWAGTTIFCESCVIAAPWLLFQYTKKFDLLWESVCGEVVAIVCSLPGTQL
jgi:hypothetical protein